VLPFGLSFPGRGLQQFEDSIAGRIIPALFQAN
jgi:hypothetical protein